MAAAGGQHGRVRTIAASVVAGLFASGCGGGDEPAGQRGVVAGAAADVVTTVALAWYPAADEIDALEVLGAVPAADGAFDVGALLGQELSPPARTCDDDAPSAETPALGVAWIVGAHGEPATTVDPLAPAESVDARSDDLVVVYASHEALPGTPAWASFETALPAGLSLMRKRWCDTWTAETCVRIGQDPFCLEPVGEDAVVILRPLAP